MQCAYAMLSHQICKAFAIHATTHHATLPSTCRQPVSPSARQPLSRSAAQSLSRSAAQPLSRSAAQPL
eukprot:7050412-Prymnesium_polylepis.1